MEPDLWDMLAEAKFGEGGCSPRNGYGIRYLQQMLSGSKGKENAALFGCSGGVPLKISDSLGKGHEVYEETNLRTLHLGNM